MAGFGNPTYWLQVVYRTDSPDKWVPLRTSRAKARNRAALAVQDPAVDFALILDGALKKGGIAGAGQILDEFQAYEVPGAKRYRLALDSKGRLK